MLKHVQMGTLNEPYHGACRKTIYAIANTDVCSGVVGYSNMFCCVFCRPLAQVTRVFSFLAIINLRLEVGAVWVQVIQLAHRLPVKFHVNLAEH